VNWLGKQYPYAPAPYEQLAKVRGLAAGASEIRTLSPPAGVGSVCRTQGHPACELWCRSGRGSARFVLLGKPGPLELASPLGCLSVAELSRMRGFCAAQAASITTLAGWGYSAKTAREIGRQNLTKLDIAEAIEKARTKRAERTEVTADWVVDELRKIGFANMADYMKSTPEGDPTRSYR
jgi:hypothetical protein